MRFAEQFTRKCLRLTWLILVWFALSLAEDVEKIAPDLVIHDEEGKPFTVRYEAVNAMLLNEFLKEHKTVQAQQATITRLEKQVEKLTAGLQKVSAAVDLNKAIPTQVADTH